MVEAILKTVKMTKIGREPVAVLPLAKWQEIENIIEDWEMYNSENFRRDIAKARKEKNRIPLETLLRKYKLV
jgi:hypothetical protein